MNSQELSALGLAAFGYGWQSALARALKVNVRTVQRWASGDTPVPDWVEGEIRKIIGAEDSGDPGWPRDEWIIGNGLPHDGGERREYIIHTIFPRFIARVLDLLTDEAFEGEADTLTGITYQTGDSFLCEFVWLDRPPPMKELTALMEAAADALEAE